MQTMPAQIDKHLQNQDSGLYPIRTVSALTGVNPITLRAWERRYNLITPQRTPKGHRLYNKEDIELINRVTTLLNQGIAISQVKPLLVQGLTPQSSPLDQTTPDIWSRYLDMMLDAIVHFDENRLDNIYNDALSLYPVDLVSSRLITPLLETLGELWKDNDAGIAEEHFFSVYLRNKLGARIQHMNLRATGPMLLVACLPGEQHETGMLLFSLAAIHHGYRALILGANLPLEQIPAVVEKRACDAIVLSGFSRPGKDLLHKQLPELVSRVSMPVFIGGALASRYQEAIESAGALPAGTDIHTGLETIANVLSK
jgi:DNA-binding transcriptional MerR regulator/methylmalonyl-CoA mutase cobalamin-binding subunit